MWVSFWNTTVDKDIMSDYPGVQEWNGAINLLLDRELDGGLNGVDVLMELLDVIPWEGC